MNRKKKAKVDKKIAEVVSKIHIFDDPETWLRTDWQKTPPWSDEKIAEFQKKLDSAFEVENGIVLVWSGDRRYGDAFYNEKGELERKLPLMFAEHQIEGTNDYVYIGCPRWLLMEVLHGSQLETSWEAASMPTETNGKITRIRPEKPPEFYYHHFKVIADHNGFCCERMNAENRVCYGKYREPNQRDIDLVGQTRENMNKAGVFQRNDTERGAKILQDGTAQTKHYIRRAQQQKAIHIQKVMLENYEVFFDDILKDNKLTPREIRAALQEGFDKQNNERFL
tara:strand:- start:278 stop:1120 length:843 start_codon:yes stop_codon:yes gene_type:complete